MERSSLGTRPLPHPRAGGGQSLRRLSPPSTVVRRQNKEAEERPGKVGEDTTPGLGLEGSLFASSDLLTYKEGRVLGRKTWA